MSKKTLPSAILVVCALTLGVTRSLEAAPIERGDPAIVLIECRAIRWLLPEVRSVAFRQEKGKWRTTLLDGSFRSDTADSVFRAIARLTELESLRLYDLDRKDGRLLSRKMRALAPLGDLRVLGLPWGELDSDLEFLGAFAKLEEILCVDVDNPFGKLSIGRIDQLKKLRNLRRLNLDYSRLDDQSLDRVAAISGLEELMLHGNRITDAGVAKLKSLRNLRSLTIDDLGPQGLAALREMPHLEHLSIVDYKPVADAVDLSVLTGMKWLTFNYLPDKASVRVRLPAGLRRLDVQNHRLGILELQLSTQIENVRLDLATTTGIFNRHERVAIDTAWLASLPELRELKLIEPIAEDVKAIGGLSSLRSLTLETLEYLGVSDDGMRSLAAFQQVESLSVRDFCDGVVGSKPINEGLDVLVKLPKLRRLALVGFPVVTGKGLANVWKLTQLQALLLDLQRISSSFINDEALAQISEMRELEELSIGASGGTVTDKGLKNLTSLKKLRQLDLGRIGGYSDDALASVMKALPNLQIVKRTYRPVAKQGDK